MCAIASQLTTMDWTIKQHQAQKPMRRSLWIADHFMKRVKENGQIGAQITTCTLCVKRLTCHPVLATKRWLNAFHLTKPSKQQEARVWSCGEASLSASRAATTTNEHCVNFCSDVLRSNEGRDRFEGIEASSLLVLILKNMLRWVAAWVEARLEKCAQKTWLICTPTHNAKEWFSAIASAHVNFNTILIV